MSNSYDNDNSGALFNNDRKETDRHPDMTGSITVDGVDYWINAWWRESRNSGKEFLSISLRPKDGRGYDDRGGRGRYDRGGNRGGNRGGDNRRGSNRGDRDQDRGRQERRGDDRQGGFDLDDSIPF